MTSVRAVGPLDDQRSEQGESAMAKTTAADIMIESLID